MSLFTGTMNEEKVVTALVAMLEANARAADAQAEYYKKLAEEAPAPAALLPPNCNLDPTALAAAVNKVVAKQPKGGR